MLHLNAVYIPILNYLKDLHNFNSPEVSVWSIYCREHLFHDLSSRMIHSWHMWLHCDSSVQAFSQWLHAMEMTSFSCCLLPHNFKCVCFECLRFIMMIHVLRRVLCMCAALWTIIIMTLWVIRVQSLDWTRLIPPIILFLTCFCVCQLFVAKWSFILSVTAWVSMKGTMLLHTSLSF